MSVTVGAFEAKTHLSELLSRVDAGEPLATLNRRLQRAAEAVGVHCL